MMPLSMSTWVQQRRVLFSVTFVIVVFIRKGFVDGAALNESVSSNEKGTVRCHLNNRVYEEGEEMKVPDDVCLLCECTQSWKGPPSDFTCARIDCPVFDDYLAPACRYAYKDDECCPDVVCSSDASSPSNSSGDST